MSNFASDLLEAAGDEPIEAIVIGEFGWEGYGDEEEQRVPVQKQGIVLSWNDAFPFLDYEYSTGYGAPRCHAVECYTPTRVLFVSQYDGSTSINYVYRNPTPGKPGMPGG